MTGLKIIRPGPHSSVQDAGRRQHSHLGVSEGGAMDYRSFLLANRLVGNDADAAVIEITLGGLTFECLQPTQIALTGAFCPLQINTKPAPLWQTLNLQAGDHVSVGYAALGVRAYLAVSGGIQSPEILGSRSTVTRDGIGQILSAGDLLPLQETGVRQRFKLHYADQPSLRRHAVLHFVPGYQWRALAETSQQAFIENSFTVGPKNDRMGYCLEGPALDTGIESLYSEGICLGAIQITGQGQPIVLMRDHQTIGGYPKVGSVISADLDRLAQLPQNSRVTFKPISAQQALEKYRQHHAQLAGIRLQPAS